MIASFSSVRVESAQQSASHLEARIFQGEPSGKYAASYDLFDPAFGLALYDDRDLDDGYCDQQVGDKTLDDSNQADRRR